MLLISVDHKIQSFLTNAGAPQPQPHNADIPFPLQYDFDWKMTDLCTLDLDGTIGKKLTFTILLYRNIYKYFIRIPPYGVWVLMMHSSRYNKWCGAQLTNASDAVVRCGLLLGPIHAIVVVRGLPAFGAHPPARAKLNRASFSSVLSCSVLTANSTVPFWLDGWSAATIMMDNPSITCHDSWAAGRDASLRFRCLTRYTLILYLIIHIFHHFNSLSLTFVTSFIYYIHRIISHILCNFFIYIFEILNDNTST